jgi:hypothetical protein
MRKLLLALASCAFVFVVLGAAEWVVRLREPGYLQDRPEGALARLHRYSPVYGWEPRPGAVASVNGSVTTINAAGMRGPLPARARGARTRVLLLGDSLAFGWGVEDGATFAAHLGRRGFDVVNLAVPGYGTDQALLRFEREGAGYQPDVVVLHFCLDNDFVDNASRAFFYDGVHPKPYFTAAGGGLALHDDHVRLGPVPRAGLWLRERSHLFSRLTARPVPRGAEWQARRDAALADRAAAAVSMALVARIAGEARRAGAAFLLAVHPGRQAYNQGSPWAELLRDASLRAGIEHVDVGDRLRARGLRFSEVALDSIGHLSPRGHEETAKIMEDLLAAPKMTARR